jgi:hypothetical protein
MRRLTRSVAPRVALAAAAGALLLVARPAFAADCSSLGGPPIVWIENGDTQEPLLKRLGKALVASSTPLRIVYKNRRTCDLANDMYVGNAIVNDAIAIKYIPTPAEDPAWDPSKPTPTCTADAGGDPIDLAIGATFLSSCAALPAKPADLAVLDGPVQSYGFIVPLGSSQIAITAEEGYFAFGFTQGTGQASPWLDQNLRVIRGATASTALSTSAAIGLVATQLKGVVPPNNTSTEVLNLVSGSASPEATIGLMGTEVFDANRAAVKLLALRAFNQRYAYFPDSTSTAFDKQNVRDGHYVSWAPTPYISRVDGGGQPVSAAAKRIRDLVFGASAPGEDVDGLKIVIDSSLVPECAMKVSRQFDGGDFSLFDPPEPCGCYFDATAQGSTTTCAACTDDTTCGAGACRHGYCEAH